jgi:hypothetical protein
MADYLNHLARMHLLVDAGTADENPYYEISFALYPNLAMDLIVPQLARYLDVERAARFFVFGSQLLILAGAIILEWTVKRRHEMAGFAALVALPSMPFAFGFTNFEFGLGIALFGIALWIRCEPRRWPIRLAIHTLFVCVLFVAHLFALGVYGLVLGLYELRRMVVSRFDAARSAATVIMLGGPVLMPLSMLYLTGGAAGSPGNEWSFDMKPLWLALSLNGYDVSLSAGSMAALLVLLGYLVVTGRVELSGVGKWIAAGFAIAFLVIPAKLIGVRMTDIRIIPASLLILPAFASFRPARPPGMMAGIVACALIVMNAGYSAWVWLSYRSDYAEMKASFALLQPYSFVLVGDSRTGEVPPSLFADAPMRRAPNLAVHYAKAFVSSFYTLSGTLPVEVRPELAHLDVSAATESYDPPSLAMLRALANGESVEAPRYLRNWTHDFQYVYLLGTHTENALPGVLDELARHRRFTLYMVRK